MCYEQVFAVRPFIWSPVSSVWRLEAGIRKLESGIRHLEARHSAPDAESLKHKNSFQLPALSCRRNVTVGGECPCLLSLEAEVWSLASKL